MRSIFTTVIALLSLIAVVPIAAQTERPLLVGTRVRITMPDTMRAGERPPTARPLVVIGQLLAVSDSALSIRNEASSDEITVPRSRVQQLEVSTGSNRRASAVTGGLIGLGVGGIIGYASGDDCSDNDFICFPRDETALGGAFLGAALGSLIGLLVGHDERWRDASAPARLSVIPTGARSMSITSTLRF